MNLLQIAQILGLSCPPQWEAIAVERFEIDSRQLTAGDIFVALRGERFDGHDFIAAAVAKGASGALVEHALPKNDLPHLVVPNTLQALTTLAIEHRRQQTCRVIALTGSNGKTTVKEMIAAILPPLALATRGNLNNHIGVPLSVLRLEAAHRYAVFELGANHRGEIAHTVIIAKPHIALINNIAPAHIEGFGSIDGVAQAKGEIYQGLLPQGIAIINADDAYAHFWDEILADKQVMRFSVQEPADVYASHIVLNDSGCAQFVLHTPKGEATIQLQVPGRHNVSNALAAATCCLAAGIELAAIVNGLLRFSGVAGRMTVRAGLNQAVILDDTYNANLRSVLTAIDVLAARSDQRIFVFGDMGELGAWSEAHHEEVGLAARAKGIDILLTYGKYSEMAVRAFGVGAKHYVSQDALIADLLPQLNAQTTVLIKGSRSSAMEKIVEKLLVNADASIAEI